MHGPDQIVADLQHVLDQEGPELTDLVERSLVEARERAHRELSPELLDALDWPVDLDGYQDYLRAFIRWVPQQTSDPAWKTTAPEERYAKEVSDRLAHFFWLVDQKVGDDAGCVAESSEAFRGWLTDFARQWGSYLDTPESFSPELLESFLQDAPEYTIEESLVDGRPNAPSGWLTFNQFFARELNPGLRPISEPGDNTVITSPADCLFRHSFDIDDESNIPDTTVKGTHHYGNISQLLEGSKYADAFAGGTFVHYMLPPSSYHRYHVPVAGRVEESFVVSGRVYMEVDLEDHELKSKDSTQSGYEFTQVRGGADPGHLVLRSRRPRHGRRDPGRHVPRRLGHAHHGPRHRGRQGGGVRLLPVRRVRHHRALPGGRRPPDRHEHRPAACGLRHRSRPGGCLIEESMLESRSR